MTVLHYTTLLYTLFFCGSLANEVQICDNRKIAIKENASIDTTVCKLLGTPETTLTITQSSNKDDRFGVKKYNDVWHVFVKHLLDSQAIGHSYSLEIVSGGKIIRTVKIEVTDVPGWPPVYNNNCSNVFRNITKSPWAFDAMGRVDQTFLAGEYIMSRDTSQGGGSVSFDIGNDQCHVRAFGRVKYENDSIVDVGKLIEHFDPDRDVRCHPTSKEDRNRLPKITLYKDPKRDRPDDPYIPAEWFDDDNPRIRYVLIQVEFEKTYTERISSWSCIVQTNFIGVVNATLDLIPTGCPSGKYGGNCHKECVCQNNATCHPFNGACECTPGFKAPDCTISFEAMGITPRRPVVYFGDSIELTCKSYHVSGPVEIEWQFNAAPVKISKRVKVTNGPEGSTLSITKVRDEDIGMYKCVGKKKSGETLYEEAKLSFAGCHDNLWGAECNKTCDCTHDAECERHSGCMCDANHWWGATCDRGCFCEHNGTCDKYEGFCTCREWTWGRLCQYECDCAEGAVQCSSSDGICQCKLGWSGDKCDFDLKRPAFIAGVTISGIVVLIVGVIFGVRCYRRRKYAEIRNREKLIFSRAERNEEI